MMKKLYLASVNIGLKIYTIKTKIVGKDPSDSIMVDDKRIVRIGEYAHLGQVIIFESYGQDKEVQRRIWFSYGAVGKLSQIFKCKEGFDWN